MCSDGTRDEGRDIDVHLNPVENCKPVDVSTFQEFMKLENERARRQDHIMMCSLRILETIKEDIRALRDDMKTMRKTMNDVVALNKTLNRAVEKITSTVHPRHGQDNWQDQRSLLGTSNYGALHRPNQAPPPEDLQCVFESPVSSADLKLTTFRTEKVLQQIFGLLQQRYTAHYSLR